MNNILIINVDPNYRSAYSTLISLGLKKKYKLSRITLITSNGNEHFEDLDLFENIHIINTGEFLNKVKMLSSNSLEKEIRKFLMPVLNTKWDLVLNLSSNRLGAIFCTFFRAILIAGPNLTKDLVKFQYDSFSSFHLSALTEDNLSYFNPLYLYQEILSSQKIEIDYQHLLDHLRSKIIEDKIKLLKSTTKKQNVILLDLNIEQQDKIHSINFLVNIYKEISKSDLFVPVLMAADVKQESYVINKLRDSMDDDIFLVEYDFKGIIPLMLCADSIITGDLYHKTLSDLCQLKSILITDSYNFNYNDISALQNSLFFKINQFNSEVTNSILSCLQLQLCQKPIDRGTSTESFIGITHITDQLPHIAALPINGQADEDLEKLVRFSLEANYLFRLSKKMKFKEASFNDKFSEQAQICRIKIKESFNRFLKTIKEDINNEQMIKVEINQLCLENPLFALGINYRIEFCKSGVQLSTTQFLEEAKEVIKDIFEYLNDIEKNSNSVVLSLKP